MKRIPFLVFIWFSLSCLLFSQESTQQSVIPVNQSTLIGIGKAYLEDSYLSPIKYEGIAISLLHDRNTLDLPTGQLTYLLMEVVYL